MPEEHRAVKLLAMVGAAAALLIILTLELMMAAGILPYGENTVIRTFGARAKDFEKVAEYMLTLDNHTIYRLDFSTRELYKTGSGNEKYIISDRTGRRNMYSSGDAAVDSAIEGVFSAKRPDYITRNGDAVIFYMSGSLSRGSRGILFAPDSVPAPLARGKVAAVPGDAGWYYFEESPE
ncbi:MAG: hypothetical protein LBL09_00645 [Oscillospiraceae bacterium]|jgi:hypothetical protein|nr:hypothetical protein [Oscillospiraceae bacterium]